MKFISHFQCVECGTEYLIDEPMNLCPKDGRPVQFKLNVEAIASAYKDMSWYLPEQQSMWRFGPLLPFDISQNTEQVCTLGEGNTPLLDVSTYSLFESEFKSIFIKDEGQPHEGYGCNPTGSFKDRGMAMVVTMAKHYGLDKLVVPTQGNAGDSLSEYGYQHGLEVAVIMPDDTPMPILGKVAAYSVMYPQISLDLVKGTIREAGALMKEKYLPQGYFNCATFQEPGWRIEGKKTMGLELAEPNEMSDKWQLPDAIFYPTGGGTGILGMWKAFDELEQLGVIDNKRPKIIAVQSEANAPVVDAINQHLDDTVATNGGGIAVSEEDMERHSRALYKQYNLWISPEGAAAIAAVDKAKALGLINTTDEIVCFNTGSAEKYLTNIRHLFC